MKAKNKNQVKIGMDVEKEHKDITKGDKKLTRKIVDAHLKEDPNYYTKLKKMEESINNTNMSKFDRVLESLLSGMEPALVPVGEIEISTEPMDCGEEGCEEIQEDISETEIANKIIEKAKKLRKKVGEESYHYIRTIIGLAEKLLELHPEIEELEITKESSEDNTVLKAISHVYDVLKKQGVTSGAGIEFPVIYAKLKDLYSDITIEYFKKALEEINNTNFEGMYLEPAERPNDESIIKPENRKFLLGRMNYYILAKF